MNLTVEVLGWGFTFSFGRTPPADGAELAGGTLVSMPMPVPPEPTPEDRASFGFGE